MKFNVTILLDRSGSMNTGRDDHEGGLKSFVRDQRNQPGETLFNLIQFDSDDRFEVVHNGVNINEVDIDSFKLIPRGGTPLLDAFGKAIALVEEQEKADKSDQVVLMVITDGHENASKEWTKATLKKAVEAHKDDWQILFLGANIDAFGDAWDYGLKTNNAININNASRDSVKTAYNDLGGKMFNMRSAVSMGVPKDVVLASGAYCAADYLAQQTYVDNSKGLADANIS
jgi:uncharacterized protein YegL